MVHVSETCDDTAPHLLTHVETTSAAVHEAMCTDAIHQALAEKDLLPQEHFVDAAYVDAALLVQSRQDHGIGFNWSHLGTMRVGKPKWTAPMTSTNLRLTGTGSKSAVRKGRASAWRERHDPSGRVSIVVQFRQGDCQACEARALCTGPSRRGFPSLPREQMRR